MQVPVFARVHSGKCRVESKIDLKVLLEVRKHAVDQSAVHVIEHVHHRKGRHQRRRGKLDTSPST